MQEAKRQALVKELVAKSKELLQTPKTMQDIYRLSVTQNAKNVGAIALEKGILKRTRYGDIQSQIEHLAPLLKKRLERLGVKPLSYVGYKYRNHLNWMVGFWALLMAGYSPALIDARSNSEKTIEFLEAAKIATLVTSQDDKTHSDKINIVHLEDHLRTEEPKLENPVWANEVLFFTSGTTGNSKVMVFDGAALCHQVDAASAMPELSTTIIYPLSVGRVHNLASIPFHHVFGFIAVFLWFTFYGTTIVYPASFAPADIVEICKRARVSHVFSVPLLWENVAKNIQRQATLAGGRTEQIIKNVIAYNLGKISKKEAGLARFKFIQNVVKRKVLGRHLVFAITGGGYLNEQVLETINGLGYPLYNGYGMTEFGVTSVELSPNLADRLKNSIGINLHGVEYKIHNPDKDGIGELYVKSKTMHVKEIINGKEQATPLVDGYLPTGDLASIDADGRTYIRGRIKDLIIGPDGENIYPDEIESRFRELTEVKNLTILGYGKTVNGPEQVSMVLELKEMPNPEQIEQLRKEIYQINSHLPLGQMVEHIFLTTTPLPMANNMKIKRAEIKTALRNNDPHYVSIHSAVTNPVFDDVDEKLVKNVIQDVRQIFSDILLLPLSELTDSGHWVNDFGGDSMNYFQLLGAIDEHFQVNFDDDEEFGNLVSINDFALAIVKKQEKDK